MVAALFAESIARLGSRVLLIDGDLSRSGLTKTFGYAPNAGTSDVLRGDALLKDAVQPGWVDNLIVLPTRVESQAGDLLASRLQGFLEEALGEYDTLVIDSPPLIGTDEGRTIVTHVGGVLLVARAGEMSGPLNEAVLALEDLKAPVIGVVGNRLRRTETGQSYR
jgi:Mrp family chromosome partitioning ATPase